MAAGVCELLYSAFTLLVPAGSLPDPARVLTAPTAQNEPMTTTSQEGTGSLVPVPGGPGHFQM